MGCGRAARFVPAVAGLCVILSPVTANQGAQSDSGGWVCIPACLDATVQYSSTCSIDYYICTRNSYVINIKCRGAPSPSDPVALYDSFCDPDSANSTILAEDLTDIPDAVCLAMANVDNECVALLVPVSVKEDFDANIPMTVEVQNFNCELQEVRRAGPSNCYWYLNYAPNGMSSIVQHADPATFPRAFVTAVGCVFGVGMAALILRRHIISRRNEIPKPDGLAPPRYEDPCDDCISYDAAPATSQAQSFRSLPPAYDEMGDCLPSQGTEMFPLGAVQPEICAISTALPGYIDGRSRGVEGPLSGPSLEDVVLGHHPLHGFTEGTTMPRPHPV